MRVLYVGSEPPVEWRGASIVMYRLLVQPRDLKLLVISYPTNEVFPTLELPPLDKSLEVFSFQSPKIIRRLKRSRFHEWGHAYEQFFSIIFLSPLLMRRVRDFRPEIIVALADNSLSHLAPRLAETLKIPLATYFADWTPYYFPALTWTRPLLVKRWRRLYQKSDVAFCTSDGMYQSLGRHTNAHVIYPLGNLQITFPGISGKEELASKHKFVLMYSGSIEGAYGIMLANLWRVLSKHEHIQLVLYGPCDWEESQKRAACADGSYQGFKPNQELVQKLHKADFLLVVMSFDLNVRFFVETSFTTKFFDYIAYGKPIIIWGPEYCTVVKFAFEHKCAFVIADPSVEIFCKKIEEFIIDRTEQERLKLAIKKLYDGELNPIRIRSTFKRELEKLVSKT